MFETQLRRIVAGQGVFLRREANALGYDDRDFQRAYRSGQWVRVHHGCYTFPDIWQAADVRERHRIQSRAVLRTHAEETTLSHASSIAERQVDMWGIDLERTHITKPRVSGGEGSDRIQPHVGDLAEHDVEMVNGVRATVLSRAVIETATWESTEAGLVVADSALHRKLVTMDELEESLAGKSEWPGARKAGLVLRLCDGRSESVGETRSRYLMWQQGIPWPELQFEVTDHNGVLVAQTDFAWPEYKLLGEFDGKAKYGRLLREGETPGDAVVREKRREDLVCELTGWRMIRLMWSDLYYPERTAQRIRRMLHQAA